MFNAEILMPEGFLTKNSEGIPQGSPLSPILCNIYLHELDLYIIKNLIPKYNKGVKPPLNKNYRNRLALNAVERKFDIETQRRIYRSKARQLAKEGIKRVINDDTFVRVKYVRYADDFLIGVRGSKEVAAKILKEISTFIKSSLHLSIEGEKTKLTYTIGAKAKFLGMTIHNTPSNQLPFRNSRSIENAKRVKKRILALREAHLEKISKNVRNAVIDKFRKDTIKSVNQGNLESVKQLYQDFLLHVSCDPKGSNRDILSEFTDKITISLTDGGFKDIVLEYNNKLMDASRNLYVDAPDDPTKFVDNTTTTAKSTVKRPLSESEKMKRVNNLLIRVGAVSGSNTRGSWKWPNSTVLFLKGKEFTYVPLELSIPEKIETELIKFDQRGAASSNTLLVVKWLYNQQQIQKDPVTLEQPNHSKSRLNILESSIGIKTAVRPVINIDWVSLSQKLKSRGIINKKGNPGSLPNLKAASNYQIIQYYNAVAHGFLSSFRCADDFSKLKH